MRVFAKSFGCSANLADGNVLAGCLAEAGYELVDSVSAADTVVYNTCAVKGPTENRMMEILRRVPRTKKLIVAGCLPLINFERLRREVRFDGVVGPAAGDTIVKIAKQVSNGEKIVDLKEALHAKPRLDLPRLQSSPVISIIPISYGCLGACAYCCVVFARGQLRSYEVGEIVERVKKDMILGIKEFWLTGQDTASYGRDFGTNLAELLEALCNVEGSFKIRMGMMTPNMVSDIENDLIRVFENEKIFKFIHLPVQSGHEQILKHMRRLYSGEDFKRTVDAFRKTFPDITLATDVICGFPGETKEAFEKTLQLISDVRADIVNISKFFSRPKTAAAQMHKEAVAFSEIKRRSTATAELVKKIAFERNQRWLGWIGEVLFDEVGKKPTSWIGRNFAYKPVVVNSLDNLLGKILRVKVVEAFSTHLKGTIIE